MWSRCQRKNLFSDVNQIINVSPASYNPYPKYKIKACRVPFNCSAPAQALDAHDVPAPCTYTIRYRKHRIKGGASLRFTEPRNTFSLKAGPSPLTYDPDLLYARKPKYQMEGKIYRGKPPRHGSIQAISIPYKLFDGFDIVQGKFTVLRPIRLDFRQRIEPLYHHFPYELSKTTLKYKGNHWSKLKAKREFVNFGQSSTPGVGTYNLAYKPSDAFQTYLTKLRSYNEANAVFMRYTDKLLREKLLEDGPAPTAYNINYEFFKKKKSFNINGTFSKAERHVYPKINTFQPMLNLCPPPKLTSNQKFWPAFNTSSQARPEIKQTETSPAKYFVQNDDIVYRLAKHTEKEKLVAPFNFTATRAPEITGTEETPGPGTYDLMDKPKRIIYGTRDANSYIPPIKCLKEDLEKEVSPCSYDLSLANEILYKKNDFHKGPTWIREKKFDRTKWSIKDGPDVLYSCKDVGGKCRGQPRFSEKPKYKVAEVTPGPGEYDIHPQFTEGCFKAYFTHNVTYDVTKPLGSRWWVE